MMKAVLERLTGRETVDYLLNILEENSSDLAEERKRCADAAEILRAADLTPSVDDEMEAIYAQITSEFLFSAFLGFKANLDHFIDPVARTFLNVDSEVYLRENVAKHLPEYEKAEALRRRFRASLSQAQLEIYDDIAAYANSLETTVPKLAHYLGYLLGNELLPRIVPGYGEDGRLTALYSKMLADYFGRDVFPIWKKNQT